jgi:hypothetical protein
VSTAQIAFFNPASRHSSLPGKKTAFFSGKIAGMRYITIAGL